MSSWLTKAIIEKVVALKADIGAAKLGAAVRVDNLTCVEVDYPGKD